MQHFKHYKNMLMEAWLVSFSVSVSSEVQCGSLVKSLYHLVTK